MRRVRMAILFWFSFGLIAFAGDRRGPKPAQDNDVLYKEAASISATQCILCHEDEVRGYLRMSMAHSMRRADHEPSGSFEWAPSETKFTIYSNKKGTWQEMSHQGESTAYRVGYVIGSGAHASGYLVQIGDGLFQSPLAYYAGRHAYGLAPGYEKIANPDFTRSVTETCVLCHSGKAMLVPGSVDRFQSPPFTEQAISCERCHGPVERHLKDPKPGSIVNPAALAPAARDSICEQCHLTGAVRVLNPGKQFADFRPGEKLEDIYTTYHNAVLPGSDPATFKVISQSEQLALSACARNSHGRLWCGTCHDPHNKPADPVAYYRDKCLACHAGKLPASHVRASASAAKSNCIACHMPRRPVTDGGHTIFTDHRIRILRGPAPAEDKLSVGELTAWREPAPSLRERNLAIAKIYAGGARRSPAMIIGGYRTLAGLQSKFPNDKAAFTAMGTALLLGRQFKEAEFAFERVLQIDPANAGGQLNAAKAYVQAGDLTEAAGHLRKALLLNPLNLAAADMLAEIYQTQGDAASAAALQQSVRDRMRGTVVRKHGSSK